jgi:hypothetical protein
MEILDLITRILTIIAIVVVGPSTVMPAGYWNVNLMD